jgi:adenine-specific DNA-methyltransferase
MTTVFVGGSRAVSKLNDAIREQLDELIAKKCSFFVGDANGADKAIQNYLARIRYPHVTVYCTEECRNNLGSWTVRVVAPPNRR